MAFHIVTNRCFLVCEKVVSVIVQELPAEKPMVIRRKKNKKTATKKIVKKSQPEKFTISISYYPIGLGKPTSSYNNNSSGQEFTLDLQVTGKEETLALYKEIIKEVQEQNPDEAYLDKLVSNILGEYVIEYSASKKAD